jgi:phage tail-like protein
MPTLAATLAGDFSAFGFHAEANPQGSAIDLSWDLPDPAEGQNSVPLLILRREHRFPGRGRRGVVSVPATSADLTDGITVYTYQGLATHREETREEIQNGRRVSVTRQFQLTGQPIDRVLIGSIRREYPDRTSTPTRTTVRVVDRDQITAGTTYYYTAFVGSDRLYSRRSQASALATSARVGGLFRSVPQIDQRLDTVPPPPRSVARVDEGKGQLERFLGVIEAHADLLEGLVEGLRDVHAPWRADSCLLDALAGQLGWPLKDYLDEEAQRNEITFAPEFFRTVGTSPNVAAMVNRLTGWDTRIRDFVRNVLVSWDGSRLEPLEARTVYLDGSLGFTPSTPPALTAGRGVPPGAIDTGDLQALFRMRTRAFDDAGAYTYDCGRPDRGGYRRDDDVLYNRETVGVYVVPDVEAEPFVIDQEWRRIREILEEFLPIQVRVVFVLRPGLVVEEAYDATAQVAESALDTGHLVEAETYGEGADPGTDRIPLWTALYANNSAHLSVDTVAIPVDIQHRSWHVWVMPPTP